MPRMIVRGLEIRREKRSKESGTRNRRTSQDQNDIGRVGRNQTPPKRGQRDRNLFTKWQEQLYKMSQRGYHLLQAFKNDTETVAKIETPAKGKRSKPSLSLSLSETSEPFPNTQLNGGEIGTYSVDRKKSRKCLLVMSLIDQRLKGVQRKFCEEPDAEGRESGVYLRRRN